uniref:Semaphorin-3C n=1 Tax=Esox lucius TaxID=8010 RepID=A0A6Q2YG83_ESOLU
MAFGVLGVFLGLLLEVSTHGPHSMPRTSWKHEEVNLVEFAEPGIFNYSTLLLSEDKNVLYVGAREAIFELSMTNVSVKNNKVEWQVSEADMSMCILKGKSKETDCLNYIRVLQVLDNNQLYVCGTHAFQPVCRYLSLKGFSLEGPVEDGRGKCSFDPAQSFTTIMVDGELYSGTSYNFLGSEPIISKYSLSQSLLRTEYSTSWLNEPSFVFADVIREGENSANGEDDKVYYFFTEVSVEYEFFGKLLIPRIARVCKCINNHNRLQNINNSLHLPDKTLQFVKDHPLLEDPVLPIGNGPKLITKDINYTQIAVERVQALDNNMYDVIFTGTDKGVLHKSVLYEEEVHTVEEIQLLHNSEPIKNLLISSQGTSFLYVGSDSGVVQSPTAFCEKYPSCLDCILTRDPYCAWDPNTSACINIFHTQGPSRRNLIQNLSGDADNCPSVQHFRITGSVELPCLIRSNMAVAVWKANGSLLTEASRFHLMGETGLLIYSVAPEDQGLYECWSLEWAPAMRKNFSRILAGYILVLDVPRRASPRGHPPQTAVTRTQSNPATEGNNVVRLLPLTSATPRPSTPTSPPPPRSASPSLTTPLSSDTDPLPPELPSPSVAPIPDNVDPEYLQHDNSRALLFLFLLFFILFLAALAYNCYMRYLPGPCLRLRAALLGGHKKPPTEYEACEAGLMVPVEKTDLMDQTQPHQNGVKLRALRDTGYETEPECGNGRIPSHSLGGDGSPSKEKPFDVDSDSQPIEFADADQEASPY